MFNEKQIELSTMLFDRLKNRFKEIALVGVTESAENPYHVWVNIVMPADEDQEIELRELASEISTDILMDYGYHITIFPADLPRQSAAN